MAFNVSLPQVSKFLHQRLHAAAAAQLERVNEHEFPIAQQAIAAMLAAATDAMLELHEAQETAPF
jgi:hypothetical protein